MRGRAFWNALDQEQIIDWDGFQKKGSNAEDQRKFRGPQDDKKLAFFIVNCPDFPAFFWAGFRGSTHQYFLKWQSR